MCETIVKTSKISRPNCQISRILFTGLFLTVLLFVDKTQPMPSRSQRQFRHSTEPDITKEDYDDDVGSSYYISESPDFIINFTRNNNNDNNNYNNNHNNNNYNYNYNNNRKNRPAVAEERRNVQSGRNSADPDVIRFPESVTGKPQYFVAEPVQSCEGKTFCEETKSSYPQEYMSNIISKTDSLKVFSGMDADTVVTDRFDGSDGGETLCGSETKIVYPKTARNGAKEWLFVLQDDKQGYKQGVKVENCNVGTAEGACKIIEGSILGYKTSCKQKYVSRVLAAVHKNGTAVTENFSMPSSCCCQIKLVGDIGSRLGGVTKPPQTPARRGAAGRRRR